MFQKCDVDGAVEFIYADSFAEGSDRLGREAASSKTRDSRHTRVVPVADMALFYQLQYFYLSHYGIAQVQTGEF